MSDVKRCVQCGLLKEEDAFRKYTYSLENDTKGRYRICKSCEAINTAYRRAKQYMVDHPLDMFRTKPGIPAYDVYYKMKCITEKTEQLYNTLEARGLRIPTVNLPKQEDSLDNIESLLAFYKEDPITTVMPTEEVPDELLRWLNMDKQEWKDNNLSPEYLQETIYESLKAKYRPQTGVNKETFIPIYDDTYKAVLNQILRRFDDYEEECSLNDDG